jgi:Flp pilus assembly protein TadG
LKHGSLSAQRGQETLQAILAVSFILLPVLFGILEFGDVVHVWIGQSAAAAMGARVAGERGEDDAVVRQRIETELADAGLDPAHVQIAITPAYVHWSQPITVQVTSTRRIAIPFPPVHWDIPITSTYVGRGEVNH